MLRFDHQPYCTAVHTSQEGVCSIAGKELAHVGGGSALAGERSEAEGLRHEPQRALVLVAGGRCKTFFDVWAGNNPDDVTTAAGPVAVEGFIENKYQKPSARRAEIRTADERVDICFEPGIRLRQRAIVRIVVVVGNEKRVVRQIVTGKIDSELRKWHQVPGLRAVLAHVGEIRERIVMLDITAGIVARIPNGGQVFGVL